MLCESSLCNINSEVFKQKIVDNPVTSQDTGKRNNLTMLNYIVAVCQPNIYRRGRRGSQRKEKRKKFSPRLSAPSAVKFNLVEIKSK